MPQFSEYERGQRDLLNSLLALNPAAEAKLAALHGRDADGEGKLPFDATFWITAVAEQLGIKTLDEIIGDPERSSARINGIINWGGEATRD